MNKVLVSLAVVLALVAGFAWAKAAEPETPTTAQAVGLMEAPRFKFIIHGTTIPAGYLLDTKTGRMWRLVYDTMTNRAWCYGIHVEGRLAEGYAFEDVVAKSRERAEERIGMD